ncbi:MAG: hypothetical protein EZS28_045747, partial [Streblomastix strix]
MQETEQQASGIAMINAKSAIILKPRTGQNFESLNFNLQTQLLLFYLSKSSLKFVLTVQATFELYR